MTQLGNIIYTDLKECLINRGFESKVIDLLNRFEPHTVVKEVWDTLMLHEINTQIPGPQEEIERLFRTSVKVFHTLSKSVRQPYTTTIRDEHLPDDTVLIAVIKKEDGHHLEEYIITDMNHKDGKWHVVRLDGNSSLEFPNSGTIPTHTWIIVRTKRVSFNSTVNIEEFTRDDEIPVIENESVATITTITKGSTNDLTNEMKVAIYREEKNNRNKLPGKYHLKQVGDVLMNTRFLVISENGGKASAQVIQTVLLRMFDVLPVQVTLHEAAVMLRGLQQIDLDRWHPLNNFTTAEHWVDMALAFSKEVNEKSKLVVNRNIFQPTPMAVHSVLSCIFSYLNAFLMLRKDVAEALVGIATRGRDLGLTFPHHMAGNSETTWSTSNFTWIINEIIKSVDNVFTRIVSVDMSTEMPTYFMIPTHLNQSNNSKFKQLNTVPDIIDALNNIPDTNPTSMFNLKVMAMRTKQLSEDGAEIPTKKARLDSKLKTSNVRSTEKQLVKSPNERSSICAHYWCKTRCDNKQCIYRHDEPKSANEATRLIEFCSSHNMIMTERAKSVCENLTGQKSATKSPITATSTVVTRTTSAPTRGRGRGTRSIKKT
jgi:hypothetical protein